MKKIFSILTALLMVCTLSATNLAGKRIYVNPGHGSFGPNDRPMATIPYPKLASTGMPDTCGFYESNTNLWKCQYLRDRLVAAGATVVMSREACGPWPYQKVNGEYPDYSWEDYQNRSDYTMYNKNLSVICEEVESGNYDMFISVHSNASTDGTATNYPIWLYRGYDAATTQFEQDCKALGAAMWPYRFEPMTEGFDYKSYYSATNMALRGDVSFMGSGNNSTRSNGNVYYGYYGVLKHGTVGGIFEGYFHTYQPARHRALNKDCCRMEGYCYYRGIIDYFNADKDTKGYILGLIKDEYERISHSLYTYAPGMHDQWLPLNGAVVSLYKGSTKIAEYAVDTCYNGVFYFGDLEPGNDYWLDATCPGYKPMWEKYKAPITVTANKVTYPRIYLERGDHEEEVEQPKTYEEPILPAGKELAGSYVLTQTFADAIVAELEGKTIRRSIVRNDTTMYVLALDAQNNPYLYLINPSTRALKATLPTNFCTVSSEGKLKLSDIAVTAEGVLIGCNEEKVTYTPSNNLLVYKWIETAGVWSGSVWMNTTNNETAGNYLNAIAGSTMAYAGSLEEGYLYFTAYTIGSDAHAVRYVCYSIAAGAYAGAFRNQDGTHKLAEMGHDIQFTISPRGDDKVMITAANIAPMECEFATTTASAPKSLTSMPTEYMGAKGLNYFKYAHHQLMTMPKQVNGENTGITLLDITEGVDQPMAITLTNNELTAKTATSLSSAGLVTAGELTLYLLRDSTITRFTTAGVEQPVIPHINAYGLNVALNEGDSSYTFSYTANSAATATNIVFYQKGKEVGKLPVAAAQEGANNVVVLRKAIPGFSGTPTNWAVELIGQPVANWGEIHSVTKSELSMSRVFNTIDNNPENTTFQRIYLADYVRNSANSGLYIVNPDYTRDNLTPMLGGNSMFGCLYRIAIDAEGYVYMPDWTDGNSGVYIANPSDFSTFPNMFQGTRDADGVISNGGVNVGSSTPGVHVYGTGADKKLIVYNEDKGATLVTNGLCIYNIGQSDGSTVRTWSTAPSQVLSIPGQANSEGNVWGCSHGIWVSQNRTNGNNNTSATSLQLFDWNGNRKFSSALAPYNDIIIGSEGSAFALSADESMLVLNNGDQEFMVFDIEWQADGTPVLTLRHAYKHGYGTSNTNAFRQLNFDYAGNLIATGDPGFYVFTIPTDHNVTVVPAKSTLTVSRLSNGAVEGIELDQEEAQLKKGETLNLTATVIPDAAINKAVTWASSNEAVATVVDGVVTAVATGNATISVTTTEGNFVATCAVSVVTPVTGITLDKKAEEILIGSQLTLVATVAPADADNKNVTWSTSDANVATVADGVVSAVGIGTAEIVVTTEEGAFADTCTVEVKPIAVTSVALDKNEIELTEGETATLVATVMPADATNKDVVWSSLNEAVATVANGVVTAVAEGMTSIIVTTVDGNLADTCAVKVNKPVIAVTGVTLDKVTLLFDLRETDKLTAQLVATVAPADATDKSVTWASSNEAVATVAEGLVTAVAVGKANITVTTVDGAFTATCEVEVTMTDGVYQIAVNGVSYSEHMVWNRQNLLLEVYAANGQRVAAGNADISLEAMPAGTYLVRMPDGKTLKVLR